MRPIASRVSRYAAILERNAAQCRQVRGQIDPDIVEGEAAEFQRLRGPSLPRSRLSLPPVALDISKSEAVLHQVETPFLRLDGVDRDR